MLRGTGKNQSCNITRKQPKEASMNESKVQNSVNGYGVYPMEVAERMVRDNLTGLFDRIIKKNEACLLKARSMGLEKLMSRILAVRKRMDRIRKDMVHVDPAVEYKFDPLTAADKAALKEVDSTIETVIRKCIAGIDSLTCMETDIHITERFAAMDDSLREIEHLLRKRIELIKKMRVYG
jgi:hypothetical protein